MLNNLTASFKLRKHIAHGINQHIYEFIEEWFLKAQRSAVSHSTTKDAAQDIITIVVARENAVGDGETERTNVVANDSECDVDLYLFRFPVSGKSSGVFMPTELFKLREDGSKNIGVVIGNGFTEIGNTPGRLDNCGNALETHPSVDVLGCKWRESAVRIGIVLNKHEVPNLDALSAIGVDKAAFSVAIGRKVDM